MIQNGRVTTLKQLATHPSGGEQVREDIRLTLLYHPQLDRVGEQVSLPAQQGAHWAIDRNSPRFHTPSGDRAPLDDPGVSRAPVEVALTGGGLTLRPSRADLRVRVDDRPIHGTAKIAEAQLTAGFRLTLNERVVLWVQRTPQQAEPLAVDGLLGLSGAAARIRTAIHDLGASEAPVLLRGPTGAGKDVVARAIHRHSARASGPFVAVNVAAIPPATAVSQLFGHARGSFTGAAETHDGWFAQAHGGTLFLDEVGDLPVELQPMLLRALETGEVQPVGGRTRRVDVRVIAATDADLDQAVAQRRFRDSLLYRLAQRSVDLPPLSARHPDAALLWVHFVREGLRQLGGQERLHSTGASLWMPIATLDLLFAHPWRGNLRELRAAAAAFAEANHRREVAEGPTLSRGTRDEPEPLVPPSPPAADELLELLEAHDWAILPAARALGVSRNTLRRRMERAGVRRAVDLSSEEIEAALRDADGDVDAAAATLRVSPRALRLVQG
ncbi:MAG: sigma-54-dependent Fis family transcriptional regulator [Deltaproteobacteria bacterium]|nr:sigma-54-dependent Fis family transcriptional regulator [Deltaproteobacteria bacterium]